MQKEHEEHSISKQNIVNQFIPNPDTANIWVWINLLFGKFNYTENGILDRSRFRFFTKSTFLELLRSSGIQPVEIKCMPIPLNRLSMFFQNNCIGFWIYRTLAGLPRLFPGLFAYQFFARSIILKKDQQP